MRSFFTLVVIVAGAIGCGFSVPAANVITVLAIDVLS